MANLGQVPGKVIKVLNIPKAEHLFESLKLLLRSGLVDSVNVVHDSADIPTAVLGHSFLDRGEVLPLKQPLV